MPEMPAFTSPDSIHPSSPFSQNSNLSSSISQNNSPEFITSATYKKPTTKHVTQLSTSSPAGIAIANQVTPKRLAHLLSVTGPLAIRHITSNLSKQLQGFEKLSLSKQRRLIMSCLNEGFEEESIIFEKIGWGQWSAKKVPKEDFIKERSSVRISNAKVKDEEQHNNSSTNKNDAARRASITADKYASDHHDKFLKNKQEQGTNDFAILSDEEESESDFEDDEDGVFKFDDEESIPPLRLNGRLISPPITSTSSSRRQSRGGITKPNKTKRSSSQTPTAPDAALLYTSNKSNINRRHSSIRSTLGDSLSNAGDEGEDTDEEDWAAIGAIRLLKNTNVTSSISIPRTHEIPTPQPPEIKKDEQDAAFALVNLRSV